MGHYVLPFTACHEYDTDVDGITVEVVLSANGQGTRLLAKIDTGAADCIFEQTYAELLGIEIGSGDRKTFGTATGSFTAFGHSVTVSTLDLEFDAFVYFVDNPGFNRNVLGRNGWLNRIRLGLIDYDGKLYLSDYNA